MKENDIRETPRALFDALNAEFKFTLDACATHENALCASYYTPTAYIHDGVGQEEERGGLSGPWFGSVWCNPPFSELETWVEKAWWEWHTGRCKSIVMLVPGNRQEQDWWQWHVEPVRDCPESPLRTRYLPGRIRFTVNGGKPILNTKGKVGSPNFGCVLLVWR